MIFHSPQISSSVLTSYSIQSKNFLRQIHPSQSRRTSNLRQLLFMLIPCWVAAFTKSSTSRFSPTTAFVRTGVAPLVTSRGFAFMSTSSTMSSSEEKQQRKRKRLVLVGGGHAHIQVLKSLNFASRPKDFDITLIDMTKTPAYSGMVPGTVAGMYKPEECLLELEPLTQWAHIDFVPKQVVDIDVNTNVVKVAQDKNGSDSGDSIPFDVISIDIGSASRGLEEIPGAKQYTIPTRPISKLVERIEKESQTLKEQQESKQQTIDVIVVGGGAAGIELSMSIWGRWKNIVGEDNIHVTLLDAGDTLFPDETKANRESVQQRLKERGIKVRHNVQVKCVEKHSLILKSGEILNFSHCLWATGATSHALATRLQDHGLSITEHGWIRVNQYLQSLSHPHVFAAGDCCSIEIPGGHSPPKAGVFAVRAGPILIENLPEYLGHHEQEKKKSASSSLKKYVPQKDFMKLLVCGDGKGLGFRFGIPIYGKWVFQLKNAIDKSFVNLFDEENLPELKEGQPCDTSQYDASGERPPPMEASEAATLLQRTDDDVDFEQAWNVLRDMAEDDSYRDAVLEHVEVAEPAMARA